MFYLFALTSVSAVIKFAIQDVTSFRLRSVQTQRIVLPKLFKVPPTFSRLGNSETAVRTKATSKNRTSDAKFIASVQRGGKNATVFLHFIKFSPVGL